MSTGTVFNVQKFSVNDGPGIRTNVFMKGCPLNCMWCHNPESKAAKREIFYNASKCVGCQKCRIVCEKGAHSFENGAHIYDREHCAACGVCAENCILEALEIVGKEMTVDEVLKTVMQDKIFYDNSGGGITLSGGEPMMQFEFTRALLTAAKEKGLHTCMETCGFASAEHYKEIAGLVDIFLFDYKETNPEKHKEFTGVSNELIVSNLKMLDEMGAKIILRCPIIPTLNDRPEHLEGIANMANQLQNILEINIEPYHPLGEGKSDMLQKEYPLRHLTFPEEETVKEWIASIQSQTQVEVKKA